MEPIARVLCPVDFSETSTHAVRYADALAKCFKAVLTLQHVYLPPTAAIPELPASVDVSPEAEVTRLTSETQAFAARAGCTSPRVVTAIDVGRPADEIVARAARDRSDLVVIGTHGASGFAHLVLGSVSEKVLRRATCPVLTVPPHVRDAGPPIPFRCIVCAVDFSDWSLAALDLAATLAETCEARLITVHAIEWPWPEQPAPGFDELPQPQAEALAEYRRYVTDRATARLARVTADVVGRRCEASAEIVHGKPHVQLLDLAEKKQADLIALGLHGRSMLDVAAYGSTTNRVIRHARCPVLTVRR